MGYLDKPGYDKLTIGSILHGAYGDYYEQLLCLIHWKLQGGCNKLVLFFANPHRKQEFDLLDLSAYAEVHSIDKLTDVDVDQFVQFQIFDRELQEECLDQLDARLRGKFDFAHNLLPHIYFRGVDNASGLSALTIPGWNQAGQTRYQQICEESRLDDNIFAGKTLGIMWRYRNAGGAINPLFQQDEQSLVEKYTRVAKYAIEQLGCHVIVAGMRVKTTDENRFRVDAKFPEYGLNIENDRLIYLQGLGWLSEVEILGRCDYVLCNPSGFSEALFLQGKNCGLIDPPLHYVLKTIKNRFALFDLGLRSPTQLANTMRALWGRSSSNQLCKQITQQIVKEQ